MGFNPWHKTKTRTCFGVIFDGVAENYDKTKNENYNL
jgi:hypothetical protein